MKNSPPNKKSPRKKPKSFRLSYSAGLLLLMIVIGGASGLIAYRFGQQALEGVTATPAGVKLPRPTAPATVTPPANTKEKDNTSPKPKPDKVSNASWMLSEPELIAESQQVIRDGLAGVTVPVRLPQKHPQRRQRRELATDSLALSRNLDGRVSDNNVSERIAELRAELWQRSSLYPSLRSDDTRIYSVAKAEPMVNPLQSNGNNSSRFAPVGLATISEPLPKDLPSSSQNNYFLLSPSQGATDQMPKTRQDSQSFSLPLSGDRYRTMPRQDTLP